MNQMLMEKLKTLGENYYLIRATVGPVQEYIREARKTRDLFIGSHLLSEATKESMKPIIDNYGKELIFYPFIEELENSHDSIPNLYMAIIPEGGFSRENNIPEQMEKKVHDFLKEKGKNVLIKIPDYPQITALWDNQIGDHFYLNWVAIPITRDEVEKSFRTKVRNVQDFLEERKLTRTFKSWEGSNAKKCVQCGHRESIQDAIYSKIQKDKKIKRNIKKNEKLCAVCLLKRLLAANDIDKKEPKFESVVDISVRIFKSLVIKYETEKEIQDFLNSINDINKLLEEEEIKNIDAMSGEWFYIDNLDNNYLKMEYEIEEPSIIKELDKKCGIARDTLKKVYIKVGRQPSKYYTIASMDGDNMGKLMSGEYLDDQKFTIDYQIKLSRTLAENGKKSIDIIQKETKGNGYSVYSGGDDILAFLPIERSLSVINETRNYFSKAFKDMEKPPTTSAGIVILHYHDPLRGGLIEARKSVEDAKEWFKNKDAFFITLRVASGTVISWGSKWTITDLKIQDGIINEPIQMLQVLSKFVSFMKLDTKNRLSPGFIHNLLEELNVFYEFKVYKKEWVLNENMFKIEFKRLLKRHIKKDSKLWQDKFLGVDSLELMVELFAYLADPNKNEQMNDEYQKGTEDKNIIKDNIENFLKIASFLAGEETEDIVNDPNNN